MTKQITETILMIRPVAFHRNEQTAVNNLFQPREDIMKASTSQDRALDEFDSFVEKLKAEGVNVIVYNDDPETSTPDSIFPNNWNSFHENGMIYLYPMFAENRRIERREDIIADFHEQFEVDGIYSFTHWEENNKFLEGTGSLILDRPNKLAYAAVSERTDLNVLAEFTEQTGFEIVPFYANQTFEGIRVPIYHTNVMMCVGEQFVVICEECIDNLDERAYVLEKIKETGKEIIAITEDQRDQFAGNMLQVATKNGKRLVVMSESAFLSLTKEQITALEKHGKLLHSAIPTIETLGGGSARCMMAEVFLPPKK